MDANPISAPAELIRCVAFFCMQDIYLPTSPTTSQTNSIDCHNQGNLLFIYCNLAYKLDSEKDIDNIEGT